MQGLMEDADGQPAEEDPEELRNMSIITHEKQEYKRFYERLRELKAEIEHLQLMLEKSRKATTRDFEAWFGTAANQARRRELEASPVRRSKAALGSSTLEMDAPPQAAALMTGNADADKDIAAFYAARERLLQQKAAKGT